MLFGPRFHKVSFTNDRKCEPQKNRAHLGLYGHRRNWNFANFNIAHADARTFRRIRETSIIRAAATDWTSSWIHVDFGAAGSFANSKKTRKLTR